jgi:hypothetical protein
MMPTTQTELPLTPPRNNNNDAVLRAEILHLDKLQKFTASLNRKPPVVLEEKVDGKVLLHVPVSIIEQQLRRLYFGQYTIECIDYKLIVNEICVHARIRVKHPVTQEWLTYDGLGAVPVQQYSGAKIQDFMQTKIGNALHKNLGAAYAFAVKNAAKKIGKLFGSDLMRKHEDDYKPFNLGAAQEPLNS